LMTKKEGHEPTYAPICVLILPPDDVTCGTLTLVAVNGSAGPFTDLEHHAVMLLKHQ
jgi:hypothetical protein